MTRFLTKDFELFLTNKVKHNQENFDKLSKIFFDVYINNLIKKYKIIFYIFIIGAIISILYLIGSIFITISDSIKQFAYILIFTIIVLAIVVISGAIGIKREKTKRAKLSKQINFSKTFEYKFYEEGISIEEPHQSGTFWWNDFAEINLCKDILELTFIPSMVKGYEWVKSYHTILIPTDIFNDKEDLFNAIRGLKNYKDLR